MSRSIGGFPRVARDSGRDRDRDGIGAGLEPGTGPSDRLIDPDHICQVGGCRHYGGVRSDQIESNRTELEAP